MLATTNLINAVALARDELDEGHELRLICSVAAAMIRFALARCKEPGGIDDAYVALEALAEELEQGDAVELDALIELAEAMTEKESPL